MAELTYTEWRAQWEAMSEEQRDRVRMKAQWEHMSLWAVLNDWPSLRLPTGPGEYGGGAVRERERSLPSPGQNVSPLAESAPDCKFEAGNFESGPEGKS